MHSLALLTLFVAAPCIFAFHHEHQILEGFMLSWKVQKNRIEFEARVNTTGWVGLGLSPNGKTNGADIAVGGIYDTNSTYYFYHYTGNENELYGISDNNPMDWTFENGYQREGITFLHISRRVNESIDGTEGHVIIKENEPIFVICMYGETDYIKIGDKGVEHRFYKVDLLNPADNGGDTMKTSVFKSIMCVILITIAQKVFHAVY